MSDSAVPSYGLARLVSSDPRFVPITPAEYAAAHRTKARLLAALFIEEKFNLLLENYQEYEEELYRIGLRGALFWEPEWSATIAVMQTINRRLVNLLAMGRLYLDQVGHDLVAIYGRTSDTVREFRRRTSEEYDGRIGYRTMEALRNSGLHRSLPVQSFSRESRWIDGDLGARQHRYTVNPRIDVRRLREDGDFKAAVLAELEVLGERIDLNPLVRNYVGGLSAVHAHVRSLLAPDLAQWDALIAEFIARFSAVPGEGGLVGLAAVRCGTDGEFTEDVPLFDDFIKRRKALAKRNPATARLEDIVIASQ